jgi:hypothetical protein
MQLLQLLLLPDNLGKAASAPSVNTATRGGITCCTSWIRYCSCSTSTSTSTSDAAAAEQQRQKTRTRWEARTATSPRRTLPHRPQPHTVPVLPHLLHLPHKVRGLRGAEHAGAPTDGA